MRWFGLNFFMDQSADGRHRHLLSQQHHEGFKEQSKSTALTGPGNRYQMNSVLWAVYPRHCGDKPAAVLEKVQVLPAFFNPVVSPTKFCALWTWELIATGKVASPDSPRAPLSCSAA
jgi:hypothetical protein